MAKTLQAVDLDFLKKSRLLSVLLEGKNGKLWVDTLSQMGYDLTAKRAIINDGTAPRLLLQENDIIRKAEYELPDVDTAKVPDLALVIDLLNVISGFSAVKQFNADTETLFPIVVTPADRWLVAISGIVQGVKLKEGDFILPAVAVPARDNPAHWVFIEGNRDEATSTVMGLTFLATLANFTDYTVALKDKVVTLEVIKGILNLYPFLLSFNVELTLAAPHTDVIHNLGVAGFKSFQLKSGNNLLHTSYQNLTVNTVRIFTDIEINNVQLSIIA